MKTLGAASAVGLAGCAGNGNGNGNGSDAPETADEDLGERVPTFSLEYWSDYGGFTTMQENMLPTIRRNMEDLGLDVEVVPVEFSTNTSNVFGDQRSMDATFWWHTNNADRLDPNSILRRNVIDWAGGNGRGNVGNYANCEYSELVFEQATAETQQEREEIIEAAQMEMIEDVHGAQVTPNPIIGAYNDDIVDLQGVGASGIARINPSVFIKSTASVDPMVAAIDPVMLESRNFQTFTNGQALFAWNHIIHSPLIQFDEDFELQPIIAESWEVEDAFTIDVMLRDDATFHNGDQITAEDVKFTWEQLTRGGNAGVYPRVVTPPFEGGEEPPFDDGIEIHDDLNLTFNFEEPYLPFVATEMARWGIMHRESFEAEGALENPDGFEWESEVGSGPYEVTTLATGETMEMVPHDGHPVYPPEQGLIFQPFREEETAASALLSDEVHILPESSIGAAFRADEEEGPYEMYLAEGFVGHYLAFTHPEAPTKFQPFRRAVSACLDRQEMSAVAFRGEVEPTIVDSVLHPAHPNAVDPDEAPLATDDPSGDLDQAREYLMDAGWGWDGDGELHYPPDADLEPLWPEGEEPSVDDFPCLEEMRD